MRDARWVAERIPGVAVIARRSDDEGALADGLIDRLFDRELLAVGAEAEVDDAGAVVGCGEDPLHDLGRHELGALAVGGVPGAKQRLRIDADQAETVSGCRDERRDRGAVLATEARGFLGVQRLGVLSPKELGVGDVDPRVDDRDCAPGGRWRERVDADDGAPPLGRDERIGEVLHREGASRPVRCAVAERPARAKGRNDLGGGSVRDEIEAERRRHEGAAGTGHEDCVGAACSGT